MLDQGHTPLNVYDANGMVIRRKITRFDVDTGEVESFVLNPDGSYKMDGESLTRRIETYPDPLTWKTVTIESTLSFRPWDLDGR